METRPFWLDEPAPAVATRALEALHEDGFAAEWHDELPHLRPEFRGAIFHPADGSLQPARFVRNLASTAAEAGVAFAEHRRIGALDEVDAERVLMATDGSGRGLLPELDEALWPARGQVIATEPLSERSCSRPLDCYSSIRARSSSAARSIAASAMARS